MNLNEWRKANLPPTNAVGSHVTPLTKQDWLNLKRACQDRIREMREEARTATSIWDSLAWELTSLNAQIKECDKHL